MAFELGEGRITRESEMLSATERPKILSELPAKSVHFVSSYNLAVDGAGRLRLATTATVLSREELEDTIRVLKISETEFVVDRSYTWTYRSEYGGEPIRRTEEWGDEWSRGSDEVGTVIGLIDSPGEFELAAPIIFEEFGIMLDPIVLDLDTGIDTDG